ncbi:MAG: CdaR family protein [Clostridia bacterium]|nr:CdaR family protein [Clostridia bacterium]
MKKTKSKLSIGKLFYNDKFVMVFSVFVAFIMWVVVSTTSQETTIFTVTDIPVTLPELSNDLRFFNTEDLKAEVKISGNAIVVASVTNSDIYISPTDTSKITEPGTYTLNLVPKKSGVKTDYNFESTVSPSKIDVYVDRYAEREITITDKIDVSSVDSSSYASTTILSQQTVKITGAESVVNSIAEVNAEYKFDNTLSKTTVVKAPLVFYDSSGNQITSEYITSDITSVDATVPVLKLKTVDIVPNIINMPDYLDFDNSRIKVTPSEINIAAPDDIIDTIKSISTSEIDFSKINIKNNKVTASLVIPSGCRNLDQITSVDVEFDMTGMTSKTLKIDRFTVINEGNDRKPTVSTKSLDVNVIGPKEQIENLTSAHLTAVIDMQQKNNFIGFVEMPVTININSKFSSCWVYGNYTADVNVVKNQ